MSSIKAGEKETRPEVKFPGGRGRKAMRSRPGVCLIAFILFAVALFLSPAARAQDNSGESKGTNWGDYNIRQSVEFGYRANEISGNQDTYGTFVNLASGVRLFDYTLEMRSLDHNGFLFDNLTFANFGYGGDPNDVSRLRIQKNKKYDFRMQFRRDKNFWDYNLFANPLNPAALNPVGSETTGCIVSPPTAVHPGLPGYCSNPAIAAVNSPHALDLVRRMQDYDLTLFPNSAIRFRLGYSHNRDLGPGFFTTDGGTIPDFPETFSYTTNAYRAGVDVKILPRTTISYDQFLSYFKQDNAVTDNPAINPQNFGFVLTNTTVNGNPTGTPVDLGVVWSTQTPAEALPCSAIAAPIINFATAPPSLTNAASGVCNGFLSYSQVGNPRNNIPTERVRFQSNYFEKFEMSGSAGYSSSDYKYSDLSEFVNDYTVRTATRGSTAGGPIETKRVSVNADWSGVYLVNEKLRIVDNFRYDNWRTPGMWVLNETNIFPTGFAGIAGLQQDQAVFNTNGTVASNCLPNPNAVTCPYHSAGSSPDVINGLALTFLGQNLKSNTIEAEYAYNNRISGYIGYLYTNRAIAQLDATTNGDTDTSGAACGNLGCSLTYYPGGTAAAATAANDFLAARGSCAFPAAPAPHVLPAGCTLNADGSITFIGPAGAAPTRTVTTINTNAALLGAVVRPIDALRITADLEFGFNDKSYTRIDPTRVQSYKVHVNYKPRPWAIVDGAVEIHENRDNVVEVTNQEHDRSYSFATVLMPNRRLSVDFGYNFWNVYTQSEICFNYSISYSNFPAAGTTTFQTSPPGVPTLPCLSVIPGASAGAAGDATLATYSSNDHFAHAAVVYKPAKRVTTTVGYGGSFVRGNATTLNPLQPSGTLDYNYQRPYASIVIDIYRGFSYKTSWNYYGFNETGTANPFGLGGIPLQDFNGSNLTFSFRYSF